METKKVLTIVFSLLAIFILGFAISWSVINFNKVKDSMSGTELYTNEDLKNSYQDGYDTALKDKDEYDELINGYRDTITTQSDEISKLSSQVLTLTNQNKDSENRITNLTSQKDDLQEQVNILTEVKDENNTTIKKLNNDISILQNQINLLTNAGTDKDQEIASLKSQVTNLQNLNNQLQKTNQINVETIATLNKQIESLNLQISDLTLQMQNNSSNVTVLNNKIAELEKSVSYYEQYIASLENGDQVVATFEFNGSVYNIQVVNKNDIISVTEPTSTDYVIFNYWTVNGARVDLSTFKITTNTVFVADVTYKYEVVFKVDNSVYDTQMVLKNNNVILPENPSKEGYEFKGWSTNGVNIVNPETIEVGCNTTYYAVFTQIHTVTFTYEGQVIATHSIRNGEYVTQPNVENTDYKIFNGWQLNNVVVNLSSYAIYASVNFEASITYRYDVVFKVDESIYNSQIVTQGEYAIIPDNPVKSGYVFNGWTIDGNIVDVKSVEIIENTTFIALFSQVPYGLFTEQGEVVYSWDEIIANKYFTVSAGVLKQGTNEQRTELAGILKVPNTITEIKGSCFLECGYLTEIQLPETITQIGDCAFKECKSLRKVNLPYGITAIYGWTFSSCFALESIVIPNTVTKICMQAFYCCTNLQYIYIPASVEIIHAGSPGLSVFGSTPENLTIYHESESVLDGYEEYYDCKSYTYNSSDMSFSDITYHKTKFGYSYEEFLAETGLQG